MRSLPHPTHDRRTFRRVMLCFAAAMLSVALFALPPWGPWLGAAGFFAALGAMMATPVNRCACPTCGRPLVRPLDSRVFVCPACRVNWVTRGYGGGDWER